MIYNYFAVPIFISRVENHERIKEEILLKIQPNTVTPYGRDEYNAKVNTSYGQILPWLHSLLPNYEANLDEYKELLGLTHRGSFSVSGVWYNEFGRDDFHGTHTHVPGDLSCVHYVKLEGEHLPTVFESPILELMRSNKFFAAANLHQNITPTVREGDLIVFPSFIRHFVPPQKSDSKRVTLSFNLDYHLEWS